MPFTRTYTTFAAGVNQAARTLVRFPLNTVYSLYGEKAAGTKGIYLNSPIAPYVVNEVSQDATSDYVYILGNHASEFLINTTYCLHDVLTLTPKSDKPTWTDIIGSPANIAATFPNGVIGQWIPVIPDSSAKAFPFNNKFISGPTGGTTATVNSTIDNGANWATTAWVIGTDNSISSPNYASSIVMLYNYITNSNPYESANNSEVLALGDCTFVGYNLVLLGNRLLPSLIGKINTQGDSGAVTTTIDRYFLQPTGHLSSSSGRGPAHGSTTANSGTPESAKVLQYITSDSGQYYLQFIYKELKFSPSYGDNSKFDIVNGESTVTDNNGNTVIVGQKRVKLPFFTGEA